jgi:DNA-binding winged helix-turn-helix (wHTH) protein/TolB-like protein
MSFTPQELQAGFLIGDCLIEPLKNRIVRGDTEVHVEPRVMDVLVCLAGHAGDVVSRDTLNQRVWTNLVVTDQAVTNCISELRQHLGDDRSTNRVIETIPKRGYRLAVPVRLAESAKAAPGLPSKPLPVRRHWQIAAGVLLAVLILGTAWWRSRPPANTSISVAVLHFENAAGDASLDYLSLALPDEIATLLTKSRGLAVRPLGYVDGENPLEAARSRHVDHIVSGRYYLEDGARLSLAIEAQHVQEERVVWRTRISAPLGDLLAMRGYKDCCRHSVRAGCRQRGRHPPMARPINSTCAVLPYLSSRIRANGPSQCWSGSWRWSPPLQKHGTNWGFATMPTARGGEVRSLRESVHWKRIAGRWSSIRI